MRCRKSIVSGRAAPEHELIRFVVDPQCRVVADIDANLPGRGAWIEASRASIETALRTKLFARSFKKPVTVDPALADHVERQLVSRILSLLGLARKAGRLRVGLDNVAKDLGALKSPGGGRIWLFEACDGRPQNRRRILQLVPPGVPAPHAAGGVNVIGCFTSSELGLALGRDNVVHAVLKDDGIGSRLAIEIGRLAGFQDLLPPAWKDE